MMEDHEDLFTKHAALILVQDLGTDVRTARWKAWCEGPTGYLKRLKKEGLLTQAAQTKDF